MSVAATACAAHVAARGSQHGCARWCRSPRARQLELERRIAALEAEVASLRARIQWWERYLALLEEARRNPANPNPNEPNPGDPRSPWTPNPMFWVWALLAALLGSLAAGLWHWLRERRLRRAAA